MNTVVHSAGYSIGLIMSQLIRLGLRIMQRYVELPAIFVFGLLILFGYVAAMGIAVTTGNYNPQVHTAFIHYFLELPLGTSINPDHINLNNDQMFRLFITWGTIYFVVAEILSFIINHVSKRKFGRPRIWLLGIIAAGYVTISILAFFAFKPGQANGAGGVAVFLVAIAAISLGVSFLIEKFASKFEIKPTPNHH
jgi:hypothetical protein